MRSTTPPESAEEAAALPPIDFNSTMTFVSPSVQAAFDYWDRQREGRVMPGRTDLRIEDMGDIVEYLGLVEKRLSALSVPDYFVVFAGKKIEAIFGARSGRTLSEGVPAEIAQRWHLGYDMVQRSGKPIKATAHVAFEGKTETEVEILVAPLGEETTPSAFFVAIAALN